MISGVADKGDREEIQCGVQSEERLAGVRVEGQGLSCGKAEVNRELIVTSAPHNPEGRWGYLQPDAHVQALKIVTPKLEARCMGARPCLDSF